MSEKEFNIGDYVRTEKGEIYHIEHDEILKFLSNSNYHKIIKSSPNIIDLIQEGDYVNGCPVLHKENDELVCGLLLRYKEENIENIVTKEQFESMKYKIGDKE